MMATHLGSNCRHLTLFKAIVLSYDSQYTPIERYLPQVCSLRVIPRLNSCFISQDAIERRSS